MACKCMWKWSLLVICAVALFYSFAVRRGALSRVKQSQRLFVDGCRYFDDGDFVGAVAQFEKALEIRPGWDVAAENLALAKQRAAPEEWLRAHPSDDDTRLRLISQLLRSGNLERAAFHADKISDTTAATRFLEVIESASESEAKAQGQPLN